MNKWFSKSFQLTFLAFIRTLLQITAGCFIELGTSFLVGTVQSIPWASFVVFTIAAFFMYVLNKKRYPSWSLDNDLKLVPYMVSWVIVAFVDNFTATIVGELIGSGLTALHIVLSVVALLLGMGLLAVDYLFLDQLYERIKIDLFSANEVERWIDEFQKTQKKTILVIITIIFLVLITITVLHYFNRIELWQLYRP